MEAGGLLHETGGQPRQSLFAALPIHSLILAEMHECGSTRAKMSILSFEKSRVGDLIEQYRHLLKRHNEARKAPHGSVHRWPDWSPANSVSHWPP